MVILFVLHRVHPNLREVEAALAASGHECFFIVSSVGPSESRPLYERFVVDPQTFGESEIKSLVERLRPHILVQRNFDGCFKSVWSAAAEQGSINFRYSQDPQFWPTGDWFARPFRSARMVRDHWKFVKALGPHRIVTPVKYWGRPGRRRVPNARYIAPPMRLQEADRVPTASPLTIVTVAKHGQRRKRIRWLLRAAAGSSVPLRVDIVGASPPPQRRAWERLDLNLRSYGQAVCRKGLEINFHSDLSERSLRALYGKADLFVMPARREYMAISPLEAMAHGLPVLVASDNGAADYVRRADPRQIFRSFSYWSFRKKLNLLVRDENLRTILGDASRESVRNSHAPEDFVALLEWN